MPVDQARITAIKLGPGNQNQAVIEAPEKFLPQPGQYLHAFRSKDLDQPLAIELFLGDAEIEHIGAGKVAFTTSDGIPDDWQAGDSLFLQGPFGNGFALPQHARRVGIAAFGSTVMRLYPLISQALHDRAEVAVFCDAPLPKLPPQVEANPLSEAPAALEWMDYLAIDAPVDLLPDLPQVFGNQLPRLKTILVEIFIETPMPCRSLADCGVCLPQNIQQKSLYTCKVGPVLTWNYLFTP